MAKSTSAYAPAQPESLRLFFGIACPASAAIRQQLQELRTASMEPRNALRVVPEANLHITMRFLGSCPASQIPMLVQAMTSACIDTNTFTLTLRGAGSFHGALWLGVESEPALTTLAHRLDMALTPAGFAADSQMLRPHLTLARLGHKPQFPMREWQQKLQGTQWGTFSVGALNLYQSTTLPTGAQYRVLHSTALATI